MAAMKKIAPRDPATGKFLPSGKTVKPKRGRGRPKKDNAALKARAMTAPSKFSGSTAKKLLAEERKQTAIEKKILAEEKKQTAAAAKQWRKGKSTKMAAKKGAIIKAKPSSAGRTAALKARLENDKKRAARAALSRGKNEGISEGRKEGRGAVIAQIDGEKSRNGAVAGALIGFEAGTALLAIPGGALARVFHGKIGQKALEAMTSEGSGLRTPLVAALLSDLVLGLGMYGLAYATQWVFLARMIPGIGGHVGAMLASATVDLPASGGGLASTGDIDL